MCVALTFSSLPRHRLRLHWSFSRSVFKLFLHFPCCAVCASQRYIDHIRFNQKMRWNAFDIFVLHQRRWLAPEQKFHNIHITHTQKQKDRRAFSYLNFSVWSSFFLERSNFFSYFFSSFCFSVCIKSNCYSLQQLTIFSRLLLLLFWESEWSIHELYRKKIWMEYKSSKSFWIENDLYLVISRISPMVLFLFFPIFLRFLCILDSLSLCLISVLSFFSTSFSWRMHTKKIEPKKFDKNRFESLKFS